jgi:Tfp pilus assembly ATPase PilU
MAHELMLNNGKVQECIYRGDVKSLSALVTGGSILGMESLDDHLYRLIKGKTVKAEEALRVAQNNDALRRRLSGYRQLGQNN